MTKDYQWTQEDRTPEIDDEAQRAGEAAAERSKTIMKDICKNCGAWKGLHNWKTDQCPYKGAEAPVGRVQIWEDTTYQEENDEISRLLARIEKLEAQVASLIEAVPSAGEVDESIATTIERLADAKRYQAS